MQLEFSITKRLGNFELNAAGSFQEGIVGVFGDSGSGKTSLLHCLAGMLVPDAGEIRVDNEIYFSSTQRINRPIEARSLGLVFQDALLFPHLSVKKNILYGHRPTTPKSYVEEVVSLLNLHKLLDRQPDTLSGGERQRVALARTLIHKPLLLLMDEPISSLDLKTRHLITTYLRRVHRRLKVPIVYVSHSVSELLFLADKVYGMDQGTNIHYGDPLPTLFTSQQPAGHEIENIYELNMREIRKEKGVAVLDWGGEALQVAYAGQIQPRLRIGLRAGDILVANQPVAGISARNRVPAVLEKTVTGPGPYILYVKVRDEGCWVSLTPSAYRELNLKVGQTIYLIIKASSVMILD